MDRINDLLASSNLLQFGLLLILTFFACSKVTVQGRACRKYLRNTQDSLLYNAMFFSAVAIALSIVFPLSAPLPQILLLAAINSIANVAFQVLYSVSLTSGPVSLTVLIINFSVLIPTALSVFAFGEKLYYTQFGGIAFLILSMLLSVNKSEGDQKINKKWLILTLICLVTNGIGGCVQKLFYATKSAAVDNSENTFLVATYIFSAVFALAVYFINAHTGKKEKSTFWFSKNVLFYAILVGVIIAIFQKLYMLSIENIDGSFMFPTYFGLQSVCMTVIGIILFKDHLSKRQKLGVLSGIVSIALMNLKIGGFVSF